LRDVPQSEDYIHVITDSGLKPQMKINTYYRQDGRWSQITDNTYKQMIKER